MVKTEDTTNVRISKEVKEYVESNGQYSDSFDMILRRLLDFESTNKFMSEED